MFFSQYNLTNLFYRLCQTVNRTNNGSVLPNNQVNYTLNIKHYGTGSVFCYDNSCTYEGHGYNKTGLVHSWMDFLTSQLKNCLSQENYTGTYKHPSNTIIYCDKNFDRYDFMCGLFIGFTVCAFIYFFVCLFPKYFLPRARMSNHTTYSEEKKELVKEYLRKLEETTRISLEDTEEENQEEQHTYKSVNTSITIESCQSTTTSEQSSLLIEL